MALTFASWSLAASNEGLIPVHSSATDRTVKESMIKFNNLIFPKIKPGFICMLGVFINFGNRSLS